MKNNYPADIARQMGADIIIGVTVQGEAKIANDMGRTMSILSQIIDVNCKNKYDDNLGITDVHVAVDTKGYNAASFSSTAIDTLIRRGEEEAMKHWDELMALKKVIGIDNSFRPRLLHPKNAKKAHKAERHLKTIAGRLVREIGRNLAKKNLLDTYKEKIELFTKVLEQKRNDKDKVYSLHEPDVKCIGKGKEHKKYEFGNKVSIARSYSGLIVGVVSYRDEYDGHTIDGTLDHVEQMLGFRPRQAACDREYRGQRNPARPRS